MSRLRPAFFLDKPIDLVILPLLGNLFAMTTVTKRAERVGIKVTGKARFKTIDGDHGLAVKVNGRWMLWKSLLALLSQKEVR